MADMGMPPLKGLAPGMLEDAKHALNPSPLINAMFGSGYPQCKQVTMPVGDAYGRIADGSTQESWITDPETARWNGSSYVQTRWVQDTDRSGKPINLNRDQWVSEPKTFNPNGSPIKKEGFENDITRRENFTQEYKVKLLPQVYTPRYVWTYWENKAGRSEPYSHIQLCFETMKKHYSNYNFIILNPETINLYLPNIRTDLNDLMIAQKVDYYRVALLEKYGGIWVDADTIALTNLDEVFNKLDNGSDFVGFGCTGKTCFNGYPDPSNGVMGSRKNGRLMNCCLNKLDSMLNADNKNHKYFQFVFPSFLILFPYLCNFQFLFIIKSAGL
jgi:hypothetical protein